MMGTPIGSVVTPLSLEAAECVLSWTRSQGPRPDGVPADVSWMLAWFDSGVLWGRVRDGVVSLPAIRPDMATERLQELRLFGPSAECLVWLQDGRPCGRVLADDPKVLGKGDPLAPADEVRIVLGDRALEDPHGGFTLVANRSGARHRVPWELPSGAFGKETSGIGPLRLRVRHYFQQAESGAVRVVASRLVDLFEGEVEA